jgi:hypothetical protein
VTVLSSFRCDQDLLADSSPGDKVRVADNDSAALPELEDSQDIGYTEIQW